MPDNQALDNSDVDFADNVDARRAQVRNSKPKYAPIGESFTLTQGATLSAPVNRRYEPLAAPISLREGQPNQETAPSSDGSFIGDVGKTFAGGAIKGTGAAVRGIGKIPEALGTVGATALNQAFDADLPMPSNVLDKPADWVNQQGQDLLDSRSPASILAEHNSTPDGSIADPSSITWGEDPSVKGYILQGANAIGSMAPVLVAGWVGRAVGGTGVAASATAGGSQGAGAAIEQAREMIDGMDDATLEKESSAYRDALANGVDPAEARGQARDAAENWAAAFTAPVSTVGGAFTGKILSPAGRVFGGSGVAAQTAGRAALSGAEEATQETLEGVATQHGLNVGAGSDQDLLEGSFGNAVLGAIAGSAPGAARGLRDGVAVRNIPVADSVLPTDVTHNGKPFMTLPAARKAAAEAGDGAQVFRVGNRFVVRKGQDAGSALLDGKPDSSEGVEQPQETETFTAGESVIWKNADYDMPVEFVGIEKIPGADGRRYARVKVNGQESFVPADELGRGDSKKATPNAEIDPNKASDPEGFTHGQTVYVSQNGRSMPVEFMGYEKNAATARDGGDPIARVRTTDGRGHFVRVADLVGQEPPAQPEQQGALGGPAAQPALNAPPARVALPAAENVTAAGEGFVTRPASTPIQSLIEQKASEAGVDPYVMLMKAQLESGFSPDAQNPNSSAGGLFQFIDSTWQQYGRGDKKDPAANIDAAIRFTQDNTRKLTKTLGRAPLPHEIYLAHLLGAHGASTVLTANPKAKLIDVVNQYAPDHASAIVNNNGMRGMTVGQAISKWNDKATAAYNRFSGGGRALPAPSVSVNADGTAMTADQRQRASEQARARADDLSDMGLTPDVARARQSHPTVLDEAAHDAVTSPHNELPEPTDAQKKAGNYKKGHIALDGLDISIENPEGSTRSGVDDDGKPWSNTLQSHYGYIRGTTSADGDHVDTFIKPGTTEDSTGKVFVVDQVNPATGKFDEQKVMLGFGSQKEAEAAYKANYAPDWKGMGKVAAWDMSTLKGWIKNGDTTKPAANWDPAGGAVGTFDASQSAPQDAPPNDNKKYLSWSAAQVAADDSGGAVLLGADKKFTVQTRLPGRDVPPPGAGPQGSPRAKAVTPAGREVQVRYRVVDADNLIASNHDDGRTNISYPKALQPRDRSRGTSELQINDIAANLRPEMLGVSATTADGAPVVASNGVVESGNGRTLAVKRAYASKLPSATAYKQWLKDQGYKVAGMNAPVLVRQRDTRMSNDERQAYTRESNERTTLQMSATEQAQSDAKSIAPILGDYRGGDVGSAANRDFVRKFVRDVVGKADQGSVVGADGILSQQGKRRLEAALMSAAYGSPEIVTDLFENADNDIRAIGGALLDVAGQWAQMREDIGAGAISSSVDATPYLVEAVNLVRRVRAEGKGIYDLANQFDMVSGQVQPPTIQFLHAFFKGDKFNRARGRESVSDSLRNYVGIAQSTVPGENMFGDAPPTSEQVLRQINEKQRASETPGEQENIFDRQPGSTAGDGHDSQEAPGRRPAASRGQPADSSKRPKHVNDRLESRDPLLPRRHGGVSVSATQKMVDGTTKNMPGASDVTIRVVENRLEVRELEGYLPSMDSEGIYFPSRQNAEGRIVPARIYLMANTLATMERAEQVLAHELVGHFGMEALLADKFSSVLEDVVRLSKVPAGVKIGIQRVGDKYYASMEAVARDYPDYSPSNQAREVLARMAETNIRPFFLDRVYSYIRKFLRSLGFGGKYSSAEIKAMVIDSAKQLRRTSGNQSVIGALSAAESLRVAEARSTLAGEIRALIEQTKQPGNLSRKLVVSTVPSWPEKAGQKAGLQLAGYHHVIDSSAIRHALKNHGDSAKERARGQLPITDADFEAIPAVLGDPDKVIFGTKNRLGRDQVVYVKTLSDGTTLYLEEVRTGRREMASQSMRKYPATMNVNNMISTLYPNAQGDGGSKPIVMDGPDARNGGNTPESVRSYAELARQDGKPWLMRSSAQKVAADVGGQVRRSGDGWVVRQDVGQTESRRQQIDTSAFKRWFGDSKAVDADGNPQVVYHGTDQDFDLFSGGGYFTDKATSASAYSNIVTPNAKHAPNVMPVYLSIKRPKRIDTYATRSDIDKVRQSGKYDGVIISNVGGSGETNYIAFKPEQVKSATGNRGTFSPDSASVLESRATTADDMPPDAPAPTPKKYRGNVLRPGENLSKAEQAARQSAMGKIGPFSEVKPIKERAKALTANWQAKLIQGVFDQFAPLKNLSVVAYMQARLSKGTDGAVEAVFTTGKVKLVGGALDVDNSGGLMDILAPLRGEHDHFFAWIAGNRAERLMTEGRERLFTPSDIQTLKALSRNSKDFSNRAEVYAKALKEFNALQKSVMDVAQEAGLIDGESRDSWESEFYVPFYRVMEEDQTGAMGPGQINGLVGQRAFKKLKGGQEQLGDLLSNTLSNWSHLLSASMKNLAAQSAMTGAVETGIAQPVRAAEKGSVRIMVKGKEKHFLVDDPLVMDALTSLHHVGSNTPGMKAMRKFKHMLTIGVTASPTFRIRNLARDVLSAMATTDVSYNPIKNVMDGWKGTDKDSPTFHRLLAGGGAVRFGSLNDGDQAANAKRLIAAGAEAGQILDSQTKVRKAFGKALDWYQELGDRGETINRAAIYDRAVKGGKTHLEASYMARDLMDFTAGGKFATVRLLTQVVPFFNARLQGMYKLGRAAHDDPRRFSIVTGAVAAASAFLYLVGKDDDEYKQLPDWVRNTYWVVRLPGADKFVYIPKPFEVGALGTVVERATEFALGGDDFKARDFGNSLLHVLSDQLAMNPIPQAVKPAMGAAFNYDDFREVDIDSPAQMRLPARDRHTARTSAGAVAVGQALDVSPQRLEFMLRGYFGWLGTQALNVADFAARPFTDLPDNPLRDMSRVDNWFVAGDFLKESEPRSSKYIQRFYDSQRDIEQTYAAHSEARKAGDIERAIELAGTDEIKLRPIYQAVNKQMQGISRRIRQVDNDKTLDVRAKAELRDGLYRQRNQLARAADERARQVPAR